MTSRLPKYAERYFAAACSLAEALAHAPDEDERGWDFLVEFPKAKHEGHADTHPPPPSAYVQIKTTLRGKRNVRVKLSNALHAAQSRQPWFVILLDFDDKGKLVHAYAAHVWDGLMRATLMAVRKCELAGGQLNKKSFTLSFSAKDDHKTGLIEWMQSSIEAVGNNYEASKKELYETLGYEGGAGTGHMTITATTSDEIAEAFLGLGSGLKLSAFKFTQARFGLHDNAPLVDVKGGRMMIAPNSVGECEIRLRGPAGSAVYPAQVYSFSTPDMSDEQKRLGFSTKFLHIISAFKQDKLNFKLTMNFDEKLDLVSLSEFCTIRSVMSVAPIDVQVWSSERRVLAGTLDQALSAHASQYAQLKDIVELCTQLAGSSAKTVRLSIADFVKVWRSATIFQQMNSGNNIRMEYDPFTPDAVTAKHLVYYSSLHVGDRNFYVLLRRPISNVTDVDDRRAVYCGPAEILEFYCLEGDANEGSDRVVADYDRHLDSYPLDEKALELGDVNLLFLQLDEPKAVA